MSGSPITEDDLQSFVDEALDSRRREDVAQYLAGHPDAAQRINAYIRQRSELRAAFGPIAEEPIPAELNVGRMIEGRRSTWPKDGWRAAAAAAMLFVGGGAGGWFLHGAAEPARAGIASLAAEASDSYAVYAPDEARPVEIAANDQAQLVRWGSRRLDRPLNVPDLSASGFAFVGGRLVATPHGPAVMYMFGNNAATRLVMLTRKMVIDRDTAMSLHDNGHVATISWSRGGLGFSLVGPLPLAALHPIANVARAQVERTARSAVSYGMFS